jgi:hypothetical protein
MSRQIICYFDNNATTRVAPEVLDAMLPFRIRLRRPCCVSNTRAHDKILRLPGGAELPLCPEFMGGAAETVSKVFDRIFS